ncbi:unnamed protein product [Clonostachys rhizophaga]|uniref:ribonuclease T2 n=1 Tax=Clonostachys rhizophaga TaxID=160324 RepID=A0A9N9VHK2_9HYPO|nr:unnamed protein product [Clonostachys rhizophaga]
MAFTQLLFASTLVGAAFAGPKTCSSDVPLSCHNTTAVEDTCCFIPSGQLLLTQFWDTNPATGPDDSWTIHGLWPDNCDGTYPANCDSSRKYTNISDILTAGGGDATLTYMETYWKDYKGDDETFWEHEWAKHGTCVSTLDPDCYADYQPTEEAVAYFAKAVELFKTLPTHEWLSDAGITPSSSKKYALSDVQAALEKGHGKPVTVSCDGKALNEVWYHYNVKGSLQSGEFVAAEPDGTKGSCPSSVSYLPKSGSK